MAQERQNQFHEDIINELNERLAEAGEILDREHRAIRIAWDSLWRRIYERSIMETYNRLEYAIYGDFCNSVNGRISEEIKRRLRDSIHTCPQERQPGFQHGRHQMCLTSEYWRQFHNSVRGTESRETYILCCITYTDESVECLLFRNINTPDLREHADILAKDEIRQRLESKDVTIREIAMYLTRSPCSEPDFMCSTKLKELCEDPMLNGSLEKFYIRFTTVFKHYGKDTMGNLRELRGTDKVDLGVFEESDWQELENHLSQEAYDELRKGFAPEGIQEGEQAENEEGNGGGGEENGEGGEENGGEGNEENGKHGERGEEIGEGEENGGRVRVARCGKVETAEGVVGTAKEE